MKESSLGLYPEAKLIMKPLALLLQPPSPPSISAFPINLIRPTNPSLRKSKPVVSCSSSGSKSIESNKTVERNDYKPGPLDDVFLGVFRSKMVQEVGWDSEKPGYDGLIEAANRLLLKSRNNADATDAAVRILRSLFPPLLLELYKLLISPLGEGKVAAVMVARVTVLTCQWLMGTCKISSVDLLDGTSCESGVFVERCKYLEESKCIGICINTCKLPTQTFFKDYMGVPLLMEPNFQDYSCQFKFGVHPPEPEDDATLREPCLEICPNATRRREVTSGAEIMQCPKA